MLQLNTASAMKTPKNRPSGVRGNLSKENLDFVSGVKLGSFITKQYT